MEKTCVTAALAALISLAALARRSPAQLQFDLLGKRHLPADRDWTSATALVDVDGDGDLDLVLGTLWRQDRLYLNDGAGRFTDVTAARLPRDSYGTSSVATGDVDGDGDPDLILGTRGQQNRLYLNDGTGTFTDATASRMPAGTHETLAVALGDVDGDGDPDLLSGTYHRQNRLYLNDGAGTFTDATPGRMPTDSDDTQAAALGDVDGDGDLDVVFGNERQQNTLYLNDGTGTFADATLQRMPPQYHRSRAVALGDVDGDGDLDMVFGNEQQLNKLYVNDGTGKFTDAALRMPADDAWTTAVALGDVDGDGDSDLVFGNRAQQNMLYVNDGTGTFADATAARMPADGMDTLAVALGDVDGDGDSDLVFGNYGQQDRLYANDGSGSFTDGTATHMPSWIDGGHAVSLGDVDGDGDADLVLGVEYHRNRLYLNDGAGFFTDVTVSRMPAESDRTTSVALGDVDGDGDLDIVFGNEPRQNRLYLNDGTGTFTDATAGRMPSYLDATWAVALGDVDRDGDLDLFSANSMDQNRFYLNDGTGTFTDALGRFRIDLDTTYAVALGDVDGDGDLDIVFGNVRQQNRLYLNDGTGTFTDGTAGRLPADTDTTSATLLGDVDGDGDLDLITGNGSYPQKQNRLYVNDGSGRFTDATAAHMPVASDETLAGSLGDVDGDGDLDIVFANGVIPEANRLYLNDGAGTFTDVSATRMPATLDETRAVALGDVDGDGDLDLVFANIGQSELYLNLLRQLEVPFLVMPGHEYRLDVHARYGPPRAVDVAAPYLSVATARIPLPPLGTLRLDPTFMIPLPPFQVSRPAGAGSLAVTLPNVPGLVGLPIHAQALLLHWPGPAFLTNPTADRIVR